MGRAWKAGIVATLVSIVALGCQSHEVKNTPGNDDVTVTGKLIGVKDDRPATAASI